MWVMDVIKRNVLRTEIERINGSTVVVGPIVTSEKIKTVPL